MHHEVITPCSFAPVFPFDPKMSHKQPQVPQSPFGFPGLPPGWMVEFERFSSSDGKQELFGQLFRPEHWVGKDQHRVLFVLHGQGEHGGRYVHFPHFLKDHVGAIYALDHRGHGQSEGRRGHIDHFDVYAADVEFAINRVYEYLLERFGAAEIHLMGHSMGGQIAARTLIRYPDLPIRSACICAPMFDLAFPISPVKEAFGKLAYKVAPWLSLPGESLSQIVSSDPHVCDHYESDPYNHNFASPGFYFSYLEVIDDTMERASKITHPVMVQVAGQDKIIDPSSIISFYESLPKGSKLCEYPEMYHEVYNEPEKELAFKDLIDWINQHKSS